MSVEMDRYLVESIVQQDLPYIYYYMRRQRKYRFFYVCFDCVSILMVIGNSVSWGTGSISSPGCVKY